MSGAQWTVLAVSVLLVAAGVVPLVRRASAFVAAATPRGRALDVVWTALPILFLAALVAWVAA